MGGPCKALTKTQEDPKRFYFIHFRTPKAIYFKKFFFIYYFKFVRSMIFEYLFNNSHEDGAFIEEFMNYSINCFYMKIE
jgi:hypothetical protein